MPTFTHPMLHAEPLSRPPPAGRCPAVTGGTAEARAASAPLTRWSNAAASAAPAALVCVLRCRLVLSFDYPFETLEQRLLPTPPDVPAPLTPLLPLLPFCSRRLVLSFDCPFETLEQRLQQRAKSSDRSDDNPETMHKRFDTFGQQSKPVIEHYTRAGKCAHISAVDGPDEIFERVVGVLDEVLKR